MKKIIILLMLLATTHADGTKKKTPVSSLEELLAHQVATKEHLLKKAEEKLQELKDNGANHAKIKAFKEHMAKRRCSLKLYQAELEVLVDSNIQAGSGNKEPKSLARRCSSCCKKHYPDLVMGTLYTTLACAVAAEILL